MYIVNGYLKEECSCDHGFCIFSGIINLWCISFQFFQSVGSVETILTLDIGKKLVSRLECCFISFPTEFSSTSASVVMI